MLSAIIVEDMPQAAEALERDLAEHCAEVSVVGSAGSIVACLLYTSPSPRDRTRYRMPSSA